MSFARVLGNQIPQVTNFFLPDTVNAPKTLLQTIWIPRQVVVNHQVRVLQVDSFARRVRRDQHENIFVGFESLLNFAPLPVTKPAVNRDNSLIAPEQRGNFFLQIIQRVAVFGEDNQLVAPRKIFVALEQFGKFAPFSILAAPENRVRHFREFFQRLNFLAQFSQIAGGSRTFGKFFFLNFKFAARKFFVQCLDSKLRRNIFFAQNFFQAFGSALQRFVNCLRRRSKPPLQNRHRETDGSFLISAQSFRPIKAVRNIIRHALIKFHFNRR